MPTGTGRGLQAAPTAQRMSPETPVTCHGLCYKRRGGLRLSSGSQLPAWKQQKLLLSPSHPIPARKGTPAVQGWHCWGKSAAQHDAPRSSQAQRTAPCPCREQSGAAAFGKPPEPPPHWGRAMLASASASANGAVRKDPPGPAALPTRGTHGPSPGVFIVPPLLSQGWRRGCSRSIMERARPASPFRLACRKSSLRGEAHRGAARRSAWDDGRLWTICTFRRG